MIQVFGSFLDRFLVKESHENELASINSNVEIFGHYVDQPLRDEHLTLGFSPSRIPMKRRWRNNGLSADFIADYLTTFFPLMENDPIGKKRHAEIKSVVSYVANELLENAMKYCNLHAQYPITLHLQLENDLVRIFVDNSITPTNAEIFKAYVKNFITSDPMELYIQQLERNAEDDSCNASGLGFLTMVNDYNAKIGWKFRNVQENSQIVAVTTMVEVII